MDTKIISLFNHKGGVSKTTTTFNLGWALAEKEKNVLIVDGDPQCNLTGTVLGFDGDQEFEDFYTNQPLANINSAVAPAFQGAAAQIAPPDIVRTRHPRLRLLAGHIDFAENETQLAVALSTAAALQAMQNLPGALRHLLQITAEKYQLDYILIDMSPSVGALNQCLLMSSDYFLVPTSPDYYCYQAVLSLSRVLPSWTTNVAPFRNAALTYKLPAAPPRFLGIVSQRYRPRKGDPAKSFQEWIDRIKDRVMNVLVPTLLPLNMSVTVAEFGRAGAADTPFNLANIADFNSLIALSQEYNTPIFALTDAEIGRQGVVLENMRANRDEFQRVFAQLADSVIRLAV